MAGPGDGDPAAPGNPAVPMDAEQGCIASREVLEEYCSLPPERRWPRLDAACRGALAETAVFNRQRYEWRLLLPLLHSLVDSVLRDYQEQEEEAGPPRPPPPGFESVDALAAQLHALLDGHEAAPFTLQRLCEVLLEPRKQYARLDKAALAIEKLLMVTSTRQPDAQLPPPPPLSELRRVNENPPSPYLMDGRPPQVLDPQQHQALQQAQAAAAAEQQQHHMHMQQHVQQQQQQQGRPPIGTLPNGVGPDQGPPPLEAADGEPPAAAAAAEAMQLDAPPTAAEVDAAKQFVESALADEEAGPAAAAAALGGGSPEAPLSVGGGDAGSSVPATPPSPLEQQAAQQQQQRPSPGVQQAAAAAAVPAPADVVMAGVEEQPAAPLPADVPQAQQQWETLANAAPDRPQRPDPSPLSAAAAAPL